jgi:N-methylhydantoinase B
LAKALPHRAIACWGKHRGDYLFAVDPRNGERYVRTCFDYDGSAGAVWGYDGYQAVSTLTAMGAAHRDNVEEMEVRVPWRGLQWEFVPDLCGNGRWRGGPGVHWEALNEGTDGQMATGSSDGDVVQGVGALGGEPSPVSRTYLRRNGEDIRVKPHRLVPVKEKDILVKHSAGGGGVGKPEERDPQMVADDLKKEFITPETAKNVYKVIIDPTTMEVNEKATKALRART